MYRVELKDNACCCNCCYDGWFLMYRVELKEVFLQSKKKSLAVPNVPCGVER